MVKTQNLVSITITEMPKGFSKTLSKLGNYHIIDGNAEGFSLQFIHHAIEMRMCILHSTMTLSH